MEAPHGGGGGDSSGGNSSGGNSRRAAPLGVPGVAKQLLPPLTARLTLQPGHPAAGVAAWRARRALGILCVLGIPLASVGSLEYRPRPPTPPLPTPHVTVTQEITLCRYLRSATTFALPGRNQIMPTP
jgi:hypothetical protein